MKHQRKKNGEKQEDSLLSFFCWVHGALDTTEEILVVAATDSEGVKTSETEMPNINITQINQPSQVHWLVLHLLLDPVE
jgi:hypothetical protein